MNIVELHKLFLSYPNISTDTRKISENCIFFALKGDNFNGNEYASSALEKGAKYAVVDDEKYAFSDNHILVENVLDTLQKLATQHRKYTDVKVIGLTGSNGKTTTKELINAVLSKKYKTVATRGNLNNHIGVPLTLLSIKPDTEIAVVEMGANHQEEIRFLCEIAQPDYGYITNFGKAHIEGFGSEEGVIKGKSELYDYLLSHKKATFLNADDPIQIEKLGSYINKFGFSADKQEYYKIEFLGVNPFVQLKVEGVTIHSKLIGSYNFTNCAAAVLMGKYFNVSLPEIKTAIETYAPENNRSQLLEKNGHQIILDAYNANPTSMQAALENFKAINGENKIVFLGDMFELGMTAAAEHQNIGDLTEQFDFTDAYLIGENFMGIDTSLKTFESFDTFSDYLKKNPISKKKGNILIKGSRGMALERVLEVL